MIRKWLILALCVGLCVLPAASVAEETKAGTLILTGKVGAKETLTVYAPFGGTVLDFTLRQGDRVRKGDVLMELDTVKVYAPCDGVVRGIFAAEGDSAALVREQYGALCFIEQEESLTVQSTTAQGYDSAENRFLHIGETVYLRGVNNSEHEGVGRITAISGETYGVEVTSGTLELRDSVNIYRDADYEQTSRIGRGTVARVSPVAVTGEGSVLSVKVREGDTVAKGDVLMELVSGVLDGYAPADTRITAPQESIVAEVATSAGQSVVKGQPVASLYRLEQLQIVSAISEMDAQQVSIGSKVRIQFDSIADASYEGVVSGVSGIGVASDNYTEYAVYIDFTPDALVRLGMSATAYLDR